MIFVMSAKVLDTEIKTRKDNTQYGIITVFSGKEVIGVLDKDMTIINSVEVGEDITLKCRRSHTKYGECISICE